ncbi:hypothetical protein [Actinomadura sp. DC4]|uniref:WXG100-like domain-containing protein n=1 Tax=Actinomadura sp. DC4 TaxID=3055069 RepID=UPI0025B24906|nr:hypothetical protein [Actinomadura sp. DC4]MDN3351286.1 hypothetical protein [Actinomadura sp. DC4]
MGAGYDVRPETWKTSGRGVVDTSESLGSAVDDLCYGLAAMGACWGADDIGRAFFNGGDGNVGYGKARDSLLGDLADMVSLVRATGGLLIVSGHTYQVAEQASTLGNVDVTDEVPVEIPSPYALPTVTEGFVKSDPPPAALTRILAFVETLVGGCSWPDGSLGDLLTLARLWRGAAAATRTAASEVGGHARVVTANNAGEAAESFASFAAALQGGGDEGGLSWLARACEGMAESAENLLAQKNAARMQFVLSLEFLLATWALASTLSVPTGGGSIAAATATTQAEGLALKALLRSVVKAVLMGMWFSGGLDAMGQYSRVHYGLQKGFDSGELLKAVGEGGVAGGVMGAGGAWVGMGRNRLTQTLSGWMGSPGFEGASTRFLVAGTTATAGNVAAQAAFDKGHVDWTQAAEFGFGMAGIEAVKEAVRPAATGGLDPVSYADQGSGPGHTPPGGGQGDGRALPTAHPAVSQDGIPNPRIYPHYSDRGVGYDLEAQPGDYHWNDPNGQTAHPATEQPVRPATTDLATETPPAAGHGVPGAHTTGGERLPAPQVAGPVHETPRAADPVPAAPVPIADLLNAPRPRTAVPLGHTVEPVRAITAEAAPAPPPEPELHPPRYVESGALGETAVHSVEIPADPREAARQWVEGLPRDLGPEVSGAIRTWLAERLTDPNRENWTDLLQRGAVFSVGDAVVYLKPDLHGFSNVEALAGPRNYPVSFGGDGVESRRMGGSDSELTGGVVKIWDTSDEVETLGLPGLGIKTAQRTGDAAGLDIMSGRKTVAVKHDYFDARVSFRVFRNGAEIPYGADVPGLHVVVPFPEEFHRVGPLAAGDGPPLLPRHEVPPGAAAKVTDHGVLVTAVDTTPLALEIQRRALEAGVPSHQVATMLDDLLSTVHSEQGMKNRSQWWLTSGSASEPARYHPSALRSAEDAVRVTSSVLRLEPVHESNTPPIETRVRDDIGRRTDTSTSDQTGRTLNAFVGVKLGLGSVDKIFARVGGNIKVGKVHLVSTSRMDLPKVTLIKTSEVSRYDAVVRLHVATDRIGSFDVDVRMELALPAADAGRFERDVFGHGLGGAARTSGEIERFEAHRQPPALAAGRGPGLGTLSRMPGSERLVTELRDAVTAAVPDEKALRQVLRDLDAHFGRPALEADLTHLLNGIDYRTTAGHYSIEVSARGSLDAVRGVDQFPMTVNERRVAGAGVSTGWTSTAGGGVEAAANARVQAGKVFGVDFPKAHVGVGGGMTKKTVFASGYTVYYRTETAGRVVAFERAVPIDVEVRVTRGGKEVVHRSWQVDGASAEVVVPQEHLPDRPVSTADVGRIEPLEHRPGNVVDLNGRLAGIMRIGAMPELALEVGRAHAGWLGLPEPVTRRDVPMEILELTRPSFLEAHLPTLTSGDGMTIKMPDHGKQHQALHVKVTVAGLEHTRSGSGVEYEQYTNASSRVVTGTGNRSEVSAQIQAGMRAGLREADDAETENKIVATVGAAFSGERGRNESSYEGGMDVARGTYGDDAHWYRGDLVLETTPVRWKEGAVEQGPTTRLRVSQIMDLVAPDQVARHLGLEGPAPGVPAVTEHRGYVSPELAMTSGYVERLDAATVLPEIVAMLHEQRLLFPGEEITASPVMEVLRARYGEEPLSASLVALRDGVVTWLPLKRAYGFSDYVGVRVRAVVADGAHTAERPDVKLMLRSEHIHGDSAVRETGSGRGAKALARYTHYAGENVKGGEVAAGRVSQSSASDSRGTGVKDINRVQTYDSSHEFTHPVRYEIEVVRSHEPPPGLEHVRRGSREALRRFAELTGNDAAGRFWDEHRRISTATRTTDGSLRLIVPEHLTVTVPEHTPVPGATAVVAEAPRWAAPVTPLSVNATLSEIANQVAVPAATLVDRWAPVAAVPPKLRGPVPLATDRPLGYEISLPRGVALGEAGNPRTMRAQLQALLAHEHTVPGLGGDTIRVGINVHRATQVAEAAVKQRVYSQTMTTSGRGRGHATDRSGRGGGSAGLPLGGPQGTSGTGRGRESGGETGSRNSNIRERNKEAGTDNAYYRCAISLVFHGRGRDLVLDVPEGLYIRLSPEDVERLNREHPGFIL